MYIRMYVYFRKLQNERTGKASVRASIIATMQSQNPCIVVQ